jgi:hypothetical protein
MSIVVWEVIRRLPKPLLLVLLLFLIATCAALRVVPSCKYSSSP